MELNERKNSQLSHMLLSGDVLFPNANVVLLIFGVLMVTYGDHIYMYLLQFSNDLNRNPLVYFVPPFLIKKNSS